MIFRKARLRLAAMIGAAQIIGFTVFSLGVYLYVTGTFDYDQATGEGAATAEAGFATLRTALIVAVALVAVLAPSTGYLLAGLALAPARRSYEAQQRFVDDASHELRTPLTALHADLELALDRSRSPAEHVELASRALRSTDRIRSTVADLLWLTRGERGHLRRESAPLDVLVDDARLDLPASDLSRIHSSVPDGIRVLVAPDLIRRAIANVLVNAVRYSAGPVAITAEVHGKRALIAIEDRGRGMTRAETARAFDAFWRSRPDQDEPGHGLGLTIVERSVRTCGGRVDIRSTPGVGTRVTIALPLSR